MGILPVQSAMLMRPFESIPSCGQRSTFARRFLEARVNTSWLFRTVTKCPTVSRVRGSIPFARECQSACWQIRGRFKRAQLSDLSPSSACDIGQSTERSCLVSGNLPGPIISQRETGSPRRKVRLQHHAVERRRYDRYTWCCLCRDW